MVVVSDTTTLSNLLHIQHTHLLSALYGQVILPQAVAEELRKLISHQRSVDAFLAQDWVSIKAIQRIDYVNLLHQQIDAGEAEAIALAVEINADLLIVDEKKGRSIAQAIGLPVIGTLGILVQAKQTKLIPSVKELMDRLTNEAGFWIRESLRKQVLSEVGE